MSEENKVVINDEEYNFGDLKVETQAHIARVAEIRREIAVLQQQIAERNVLLQAYTQSIVEGVKPAEDEEPEAEVAVQ
jgi:ABC-type sugar transport system ATPase subunit